MVGKQPEPVLEHYNSKKQFNMEHVGSLKTKNVNLMPGISRWLSTREREAQVIELPVGTLLYERLFVVRRSGSTSKA